MYRKVTRTGPATHTIALPAAWVRKHNLEARSTVEVEEAGNKLIIAPELQKAQEHIRVPYNKALIEPMLEKLYIEAAETITIYSEEKLPHQLKNIIKKFPGYHLIEEEKTKITITRALKPTKGNREAMLRRAYRLLQESLETNPATQNEELDDILNIVHLEQRDKETKTLLSLKETIQNIQGPLYDDTHANLKNIFKLLYKQKYLFSKTETNQLAEIFSKQEELFTHYLRQTRSVLDVAKAYHLFELAKDLRKEILYKQSVESLSKTTKETTTKKFCVGVCLKNQSNKFWEEEVKRSMEETAHEYKDSAYDFKAPYTSFDIQEQDKILQKFIKEGVDGIILAPIHPKKLAKTIEKINKLNIPLVIMDTDLEIKNIDYHYIGFDNYEGGKATGEYLKTKLKKGSKVLIIEGHLKGNFTQRVTGCIDALGKDYKTDVIKGEFLESVAYEEVLEYLKDNDVDAIFATNDTMALGAVRAAKKLNKKLFICGFDRTDQGMKALEKGDLLSTVNTKPKELGVLSIQTMENILKKKKVAERLEYGIELVKK